MVAGVGGRESRIGPDMGVGFKKARSSFLEVSLDLEVSFGLRDVPSPPFLDLFTGSGTVTTIKNEKRQSLVNQLNTNGLQK